jgi:hypothetical protein
MSCSHECPVCKYAHTHLPDCNGEDICWSCERVGFMWGTCVRCDAYAVINAFDYCTDCEAERQNWAEDFPPAPMSAFDRSYLHLTTNGWPD